MSKKKITGQEHIAATKKKVRKASLVQLGSSFFDYGNDSYN